MAVYNFSPVPAWGQAGSFARIGAKKSTTFPCTLPGGGSATVVQSGTTKVGYVESDANGLIPAFTTTDIPTVVIDFGIGQLTINSLEAISAGASSAAAAAASATAAAASQTAAASSATAAQAAFGNLVIDITAPAYGAVGDGTTNDAAAIQAAINAAPAGSTILFPHTGSGSSYKIATGLTVSTANLRFVGTGRDYATQITGATASMTMLTVKATGFVFEDVMLVGDGGTNGAGATINGIDLFGDIDGNVDATIGGNIIGMAVGLRTRGRNAIVRGSFTSCLKGWIIDGKDATYHTGANADQNRGNTATGARFHNIGNAATDAAVEFTSTSKVLHATIQDCFFDSTGLGRHIVATGTSANPIKQLRLAGNKHMEAGADVYALTYCNYASISDAQINGSTVSTYGNGFVINNCDTVQISNPLAVQLGKSGVYARNTTRLLVRDATFITGGIDPASTGHGFDVDSTNAGASFDRCKVITFDGWGFTGEPSGAVMTDCEFLTNTLGTINSGTVTNRIAKGLNTYVEGKFGRYEDVGRKPFDFAAATATQVASIAGGGNFSSFIFEVAFTARDGGGDCYVLNRYSVRSENGAPVVTAIGTAAASRVTVTTAASGTTGVAVSLNCTAAASGVVTVKAYSGGAANTTNGRGVVVTMS